MDCALITGGNGNLGALVAQRLLENGTRVVKFDIPGTEPETVRENETVVVGDIRDTDLLRKILVEHKPATIYHLASLLSGSSEADPEAAWEINANSSFWLLRLADELQVKKFFFASTLATFADGVVDPMPEDQQQWPNLIYGVTKVAVERLGVYFKLRHGMDFRCLRFPLVISPYAPPAALTAFPSHAFKAACNGETSFTFPIDADTGMSTLYLDDVVKSIVEYTAVDQSRLKHHVYSLHSYFVNSRMVADSIRSKYPDMQFEFQPVAAVDEMFSSLPDVLIDQNARDDWGWQPDFDFAKSADTMFDLFSKNTPSS